MTLIAAADIEQRNDIPTADELFARARALVPYLADHVDETNALRRVPDATVARMKEAGLFRVLQPRRWGGYEMHPEVFYDIQMILGEGDMSAAWVYGIVGVHNWHLALFDDRAAHEVWGDDQDVLIASTYMPVGKLAPVDGGYILNGRWSFSSGCDNCDWILLGGMLPEDGSGDPRQCSLLIPAQDLEIVDTWHVTGLKGTGSKDIVVTDKFVPAHRLHTHIQGFRCDSPGNAVNTAPLYRLPFGQVFIRAINSAAVGAAQGMLDAVIDYAGKKAGPYGKLGANVTAQQTCALAASEVVELKSTMRANFRADGGAGRARRADPDRGPVALQISGGARRKPLRGSGGGAVPRRGRRRAPGVAAVRPHAQRPYGGPPAPVQSGAHLRRQLRRLFAWAGLHRLFLLGILERSAMTEMLSVDKLRRSPPYPVGAYIDVLGGTVKLHYNEMGRKADGKPSLIFLHGSGPGASGYNNFKGNYPYFADLGYHTIALDYVGYGLSDKPDGFVYDTAVQAQAVHDVITQLGLDKIVLIGNSLGGYISLVYTLDHPDKVEKLVLMASGGLEERTRWLPDSRGMAEMGKTVRARAFDRDSMRSTLSLIVYDQSLLSDEVLDERLAIAASQPSEVWTNQRHSPTHERLGEIRAPILCFWGIHDQFLPVRHAMLLLERAPDARAIISNRAGHWFMIEESELFNSATAQFLAN